MVAFVSAGDRLRTIEFDGYMVGQRPAGPVAATGDGRGRSRWLLGPLG